MKIIDVGRDFSPLPFGRYRKDGRFSGEAFRDDLLIPALKEHGRIMVDLDGAKGLGSSFLHEAFVGLARLKKWNYEQFSQHILIRTKINPTAEYNIKRWIESGK